ncbi:M23 family metallopeptidase [Promicromonospora sp. NPDC057138]|uniref:M23 family metallopeptidase n=1 Tax=Promicromonospora sp. NPDC057138 TaxID=3346031 RepID=UPI00362BC300
MTTLRTRSPGPALGRIPATLLTVLLAVVLLALTASAPAAAVRSGPDLAIRASTSVQAGAAFRADVGFRAGLDDRARVDDGADADSRASAGVPPAATGYVPPVPGVDPPSGVERLFDPPEEEWGPGHRGVDLLAPEGSRVLSPGPGVVTFAGQVAERGVVVVTHPDGLRTSLEPVAASVPVGTAVTAGAQIGIVEGGHTSGGEGGADEGAGEGDSATPNHCAPRSCVHWGVRRGERYVDPLSLLDRPPIVLLPDP